MMNDASESHKPVKRGRPGFSEEFKREAVRLVAEENYTFKAAAEAVGVNSKTLRDWYQSLATPPEPCADDASLEQLRDENRRLRKQLRQAELEREILKKATAYFAKESQ